MPLKPNRPLLYLITSGATNEQTTSSSRQYAEVLKLIYTAVAAEIDIVQLREKNLTIRVLFELANQAAEITRGTPTQLLINDRSDVAVAVGADGVHLTSQSIPIAAVREAFGPDLLIAVSTHSFEEAGSAKTNGADFIVFGPVFNTLSKPSYGKPVGVEALAQVISAVAPLPVIALGGIDLDKVAECVHAGVAGVAAITLFNNTHTLNQVTKEVRARFKR